MDAANSWKPAGYHPPCPVCAHRTSPTPMPSVRRVADGSSVDADVVRGASLVASELELDEIPRIGADVVGILIPSLSTDDVIQLRIPRDCVDAAPSHSAGDSHITTRRLANAVVLPPGWYLVEASLSTIVSRTRSGSTRIEFDAPTDDATEIVLTIVRHAVRESAFELGA
jgi:hypothetical protein